MKKSQLVESISQKSNLKKNEIERALKAIVETIVEAVDGGNKVSVLGLGSFEKIVRSARMGINPTTGEKIKIYAKNIPKFKASKSFKDKIA